MSKAFLFISSSKVKGCFQNARDGFYNHFTSQVLSKFKRKFPPICYLSTFEIEN